MSVKWMRRDRTGNQDDREIAGYADRKFRNPFRSDYVSGPNSAAGALRMRRPGSGIFATAGLKGDVRYTGQLRSRMGNRELADVRKIVSGTGRDTRGITRQVPGKEYVTGPSGEKDALKVGKPERDARRGLTVTGDIKTSRGDNSRGRDPSRQMKANETGIQQETGMKRIWKSIFGKAEEDSKKGKSQKPRYDPREIGIWYD